MTALSLTAQTSAGRVSGVVTDAHGAVIQGAKIRTLNSENGSVLAVNTNGEGQYVLYPLAVGTYSILIEAGGFRGERFEGVEVGLQAILRRDAQLEVMAAQRETLVVNATGATVSESPSVQTTMVTEQIQSLPLNARDFNQLVNLAAGAVENVYPGGDFGGVAVNGNRAYGNDYVLDGTPNTNPFVRTSAAGVSVDTIREFKVTSGVATAEYGQAGSQVSVVTRSGTNQFHGSLFEYNRGNLWQALSPFAAGVIPPFERNQFGGSLGGPVIKNKAFFFVNYEGNRQDQGTSIVATMPSASFWNGDFSSLLTRNITIRDPLSSARTPFAGNLLPASRINAIALGLHPYWQAPNRPGVANNFGTNSSLTNTSDQFTIRADYTLPRNNSLSFRFTQTESEGFSPSVTANASGTQQRNAVDNASLTWTTLITSAIVNELRMGFSDFHGVTAYMAGGLPTTDSLGIVGFAPVGSISQPIPKISFAGNDAFTMLNYGPNINYGEAAQNQGSKTINIGETFSWVRGNHTIKIGLDYRHQILPSLLQPGASGLLTFNGSTGVASTSYSFADFMLGLPASAQQVPLMGSITLRQHELGSYVQDDWRVLPRLTLSLGLRHELLLNPTEDHNRLSEFDPSTGAIVVASDNGVLPSAYFSPVIVANLSDGKGNWKFPLVSDKQANYPSRSLLDTRLNNWGPRFGFALRLPGSRQFVMRGGYGIFYNRYPIQNMEQIIAINPPFAGTFNFTQTITGGTPSITMQNPFGSKGTATVAPGGLERDWKLPSNQQWNLTMEREIGWGSTLSLAYIGNKGTHLFRAKDANGPYIDPVTGAQLRRYQGIYGTVAISERTTDATSIYHSMQTVFRRHLSKGVLVDFNWTWAKGLDNVGTALNVSALDVENLGRDRSDSDYVRRHTFHMNAMWELPFGQGKALLSSAPRWVDAIAGGWRLSGVWSRYSGIRFTPTINNTGLANTRPMYVYGQPANLPADQRSSDHWFNQNAFATPPVTCGPNHNASCFGNAGRNILVGPGLNGADASLSKTVPVFGDRRRLTFRVEMFNAFNHPNYGKPDPNISNVNTVGSINTVVKDMREAQFAVRFDF